MSPTDVSLATYWPTVGPLESLVVSIYSIFGPRSMVHLQYEMLQCPFKMTLKETQSLGKTNRNVDCFGASGFKK